tara:strand:+ start:3235 stop:3414 length:180 start_codon:yes stop_codon:yes gene_type:complete
MKIDTIPTKGISLSLFSIIASSVILIYFSAWDSTNKLNENSNYQTSWIQEGSVFLCPLH